MTKNRVLIGFGTLVAAGAIGGTVAGALSGGPAVVQRSDVAATTTTVASPTTTETPQQAASDANQSAQSAASSASQAAQSAQSAQQSATAAATTTTTAPTDEVPNVTDGAYASQASATISAAGLVGAGSCTPAPSSAKSNQYGQVQTQSPAPGTVVPAGSTVSYVYWGSPGC